VGDVYPPPPGAEPVQLRSRDKNPGQTDIEAARALLHIKDAMPVQEPPVTDWE
jgi:hypothetical protein